MTRAIFESSAISRSEAERLVASVSWFHRIEVVPGIVTPGVVPPAEPYNAGELVDSFNIDQLAQSRVLEIGTWDGPLAYELKRRGVDVIASDIQNPEKTGFNVMGLISGLSIPYVRCSVYELTKHFGAEFDVVLFLGVFYHLKHPILAFEQIAQVLKPGALLITEGGGLGSRLETLDGKTVLLDEGVAAQFESLDTRGVPLVAAYPGRFTGADNWFFPNRSALKGWLVTCGFEAEAVFTMPGGESGLVRTGARARKVSDSRFREHGLTGEEGEYTSDLSGAVAG